MTQKRLGELNRSGDSKPLGGAVCEFDIHWPPQDPAEDKLKTPRPLLQGALALQQGEATNQAKSEAKSDADELRINVTITRPSTEADRQYWNRQLAFADLAWMDEVRVWDKDQKWLWPNLPFLLRLHGEERVERYGGLDPSKLVDNDFAALLIRKFDASGQVEDLQTTAKPLVSAEWRPVGLDQSDTQTIVHQAQSETFSVRLGGGGNAEGKLKIWLIYADFLDARLPRSWPQEREWAGGILAYLEVDWKKEPGQAIQGSVRHLKPRESTRFDWSEWTAGSGDSSGASRLSDRAEASN